MIELLIGFALGAASALAGVFAGSRIGGKTAEVKQTDHTAAETDEDKEERRRSREIDEGIQNLMTFSVNGKDGFDVGGL